MDEAQFLGYLVMAVVTLGAFMMVVNRMTQPINDLKVVIQELRDCISSIKEDNAVQNRRIEEHGKQIDDLRSRVNKVETKVDLFHGK